jgi:hypothetical protein
MPIGNVIGAIRSYIFIDFVFVVCCSVFLFYIFTDDCFRIEINGYLALFFMALNTIGLFISLLMNPETFSDPVHIYINLFKGIIIYIIAYNLFYTKDHFLSYVYFLIVIAVFASTYLIIEYLYVKESFYTTFNGLFPVWRHDYYQSALLELTRSNAGNLFWMWLGGSNGRATLLFLFIAIGLGFINIPKFRFESFILGIIILLLTVVMYLQGSSSKLIFLIMIFLFWFYKQMTSFQEKINFKRAAIFFIVFITIFVCGFFVTPLKTKFIWLLSGKGTFSRRIDLFVNYLQLSAGNGFLGNGFHKIYLEKNSLHPHNVFLETLSDSGMIGMATLMLIFYFSWKNSNILIKTSDVSLKKIGVSLQLLIISSVLCFTVSNYLLKLSTFQVIFWVLIGSGSRLSVEYINTVSDSTN